MTTRQLFYTKLPSPKNPFWVTMPLTHLYDFSYESFSGICTFSKEKSLLLGGVSSCSLLVSELSFSADVSMASSAEGLTAPSNGAPMLAPRRGLRLEWVLSLASLQQPCAILCPQRLEGSGPAQYGPSLPSGKSGPSPPSASKLMSTDAHETCRERRNHQESLSRPQHGNKQHCVSAM